MNRRFLILAVVCGVLSLLAVSSAISVGVSPATLSFDNMMRGGYAERSIVVSTSGSEVLAGTLSVTGDIKDWVTFEPAEFELQPKQVRTIKAIIRPPQDIANGAYAGIISVGVRAKSVASSAGSGVSIGAAAAIRTTATISNVEIKAYRVTGISVKDIEENHPMEAVVNVLNTGNVKIRPNIHIDILDQKKENIVKSVDYAETELLPTTSGDILILVPTDGFNLGQYWARVTAYLDGQVVREETLTFDLLERGALRVKGVLLSVSSGVWVDVGDMVKVSATFSNIGEMITLAKAKFEVYSNGTLAEVLNSEEVQVGIGETADLVAYYRPAEPGSYEIKGVVFYSKKISEEKSTILNVLEKMPEPAAAKAAASGSFDFIPLVVLVAIAAIAVLFFKMRSGGTGRRRR